MQEAWRHRVAAYWSTLKEHADEDAFRNVMDMNAGFGSFAAAFEGLPGASAWVMNAVPPSQVDALQTIYDRGLLGVYHDW